jgi:outer membrane protein OmpA-like peptidoglycan-associated protein
VYLVGHTDSVGTNNYVFGLDRANNVKDYFISQDISASIIEATSRGEDEPIADNYSERGRAKNRRIEITIK